MSMASRDVMSIAAHTRACCQHRVPLQKPIPSPGSGWHGAVAPRDSKGMGTAPGHPSVMRSTSCPLPPPRCATILSVGLNWGGWVQREVDLGCRGARLELGMAPSHPLGWLPPSPTPVSVAPKAGVNQHHKKERQHHVPACPEPLLRALAGAGKSQGRTRRRSSRPRLCASCPGCGCWAP